MIETYFELKNKLKKMPTGSFAVLKKSEHDQIRTVFVYNNKKDAVVRKFHDGSFHDDASQLFELYWQGISIVDFSVYCASIDSHFNLTFNKESE